MFVAILKKPGNKGEEGQAIVEYILLVSIVVGFFLTISQFITRTGISKKFTQAVQGPFAAAYRYGHPKAKGFEDGGPAYHPRAYGGGENNFRIFLNPDAK